MPRFHFHTRDAVNGVIQDSCDLPSVVEARQTTVVFAGDVLRELGARVYDDDLHIIVTDEDEQLCWDLKISGLEGPGARPAND